MCVEKPFTGAAWIIDEMSFLQQLKDPPATFVLLSKYILDILLSLARSNSSKYDHFVTDCYLDLSIKNAEREKVGLLVQKFVEYIQMIGMYLISGRNF